MSMNDLATGLLDRLSFRNVMQLPLLLILPLTGATSFAQAITVRLVNGRDGRPMASACVEVSAENRMAAMLVTDKNGIASLNLMGDNNDHWKDCGVHGVSNAAIQNGDILRIGVDQYLTCQPRSPAGSRHLIDNISTRQVVDRGFVTPNDCGKSSAVLKPGEITVFIRPYNFWEILRSIPRE